ncbi:hypothetical protein R69919_01202 [Paraburkholderia gardini]|uniref:Transmembrane protein n=2 Tax=Paraburkholderia gardini TaxID=2823469 RepID=A0ABN7QFJ5_9BURK|nr:hypothetical protein R54767_00520 [Paraburkholderia gardini]CAG4891537.1 hypothetical protein R69919_01202 [Paraburkholderia gardini]
MKRVDVPLAVHRMQKIILPFVSGFLASLFFHESTLALLHAAGLIDPSGFSTDPFLPAGLPTFIANAIWSACWAVLMAWLLRVSPERIAPWVQAFVFGGVVLTAADVFVVDPLRGIWPSGNMLPRLAVGFAANAMWGWGALVFMRAFMASNEEE